MTTTADPVTVAVTGPHCPACCPVARLEHDAFQRGYDLGRPCSSAPAKRDAVWGDLLLLLLFTILLLKWVKRIEDPPISASSPLRDSPKEPKP